MKFRISAKLKYNVTERSTFLMNIAAANYSNQTVDHDELSLEPEVSTEEYVAPESKNRTHRFSASPGKLNVNYEADVSVHYQLDDPSTISSFLHDELPIQFTRFIAPSRYCQSDELKYIGKKEFGNLSSGYPQVTAICEWIDRNIDYVGQTTDEHTTALDTLTQRKGVCRDFAHLGVAFCRTLNIPARFVSGYAPEMQPPDFHALFEVWLDGHWYLFDPSRRINRTEFIRIGTGRDAADVPFANIIGNVEFSDLTIECLRLHQSDNDFEGTNRREGAVRVSDFPESN